MRSVRFGLLLCTLLLSIPVWPRQSQAPATPPQDPTATTPPPVTKDAQALSVVNQALSVAGGVHAIMAITDYTATGTVTYHLAQDVQGTVTLRGLGLGEFRMDSNLPSGVRSEAINGDITIKAEDGTLRHNQAPMNPSRLVIPHMLLAPALNSTGFSIFYRGLVEIDGHSVHDVEVQRVLPLADPGGRFREYHTTVFFIDASTFQVLMMKDVVPHHEIREIRYSDFRSVTGVLVPFSINELINGQPAWEMTVGQIVFSSGLQDSDFQL